MCAILPAAVPDAKRRQSSRAVYPYNSPTAPLAAAEPAPPRHGTVASHQHQRERTGLGNRAGHDIVVEHAVRQVDRLEHLYLVEGKLGALNSQEQHIVVTPVRTNLHLHVL